MTLTEVYEKSGKPLKDRSETIRLMKAVLGQDITDDVQLSRPPLAEVFGTGPMLISDIPAACFEEGVHVGIDEAGRGSVLGPMTYGAAFWNKNAEHIPKDFNDSKQLSEETRARLLLIKPEFFPMSTKRKESILRPMHCEVLTCVVTFPF